MFQWALVFWHLHQICQFIFITASCTITDIFLRTILKQQGRKIDEAGISWFVQKQGTWEVLLQQSDWTKLAKNK